MEAADTDQAIEMVAASFHGGEPLTSVCGCTLESCVEFVSMYAQHISTEGNTVVTRDMDDLSVLDAFLCEDYSNGDPEGLSTFLASSWKARDLPFIG